MPGGNKAKINNAKCGFDAEDFHRHENSDDISNFTVKLKMQIEQAYIPQVDYMTAASPLIAGKYANIFSREVTPVLNTFPKTGYADILYNTTEPLQLFWFSQTIGPNRGLEEVVEAIKISGIAIHLHLLGSFKRSYKLRIDNLTGAIDKLQLTLHEPVFPDAIVNMAMQFDIGLAAEPFSPINRDICLTNKLFTYIQCGLAVVASTTAAQKVFFHQYPQVGHLYNNTEGLAAVLTMYNQHRDVLYETKKQCFALGQTTLNWESESPKLLSIINEAVQLH